MKANLPKPTAPKSTSRGEVTCYDPKPRYISSTINCAEINRACDAYFIRTIPGYRVMNIGSITPKRSA